jgi:nucleotide-binding universal stress UspA family protein
VAEEEWAGTILAALPSDRVEALSRKRVSVGLKRYRVLPGEAVRVVALFRSAEQGRAVLDLARVLANAEAIEVRTFRPSSVGEVERGEIQAWAQIESGVPFKVEELAGWISRDPESIWASLGTDLPDVLLLEKSECVKLFHAMTPELDTRLRRYGTVVLAVPEGDTPLHRILVATAAGAPGREDVRFAARLARRVHAEIVLLHVMKDRRGSVDVNELASRGVAQARHLKQDLKLMERLGIPAKVVIRRGAPADEILQEAEASDAGLVVVGGHLHGRTELQDVAGAVVEASGRPTAVVYARLV